MTLYTVSLDTKEGACTPGYGSADALLAGYTDALSKAGASDPALIIAQDGSVGLTAQYEAKSLGSAVSLAIAGLVLSLGLAAETVAYAEAYAVDA